MCQVGDWNELIIDLLVMMIVDTVLFKDEVCRLSRLWCLSNFVYHDCQN